MKLLLLILILLPTYAFAQQQEGFIISDYSVVYKLHHTSDEHTEKWTGFTGDNDLYVFYYDSETKLFAWGQRMYMITYNRTYEYKDQIIHKMIIEDAESALDLYYNVTKDQLCVFNIYEDIKYKTIYYNDKGLTVDDIDLSAY